MYSQSFMRAINCALSPKVEGGLSLDPEDNGNWTGGKKGKGELVGTKFGISAAAYPSVDIRTLTQQQAAAIYYRDYWAKIRGDELPPRVALVVFDCAINQGVEAAGKLLQRALGFGTDDVDGVIGPQTIAGARTQEPDEIVVKFMAERALRYTQAPTWKTHGRGWMRRLMTVTQEATR